MLILKLDSLEFLNYDNNKILFIIKERALTGRV